MSNSAQVVEMLPRQGGGLEFIPKEPPKDRISAAIVNFHGSKWVEFCPVPLAQKPALLLRAHLEKLILSEEQLTILFTNVEKYNPSAWEAKNRWRPHSGIATYSLSLDDLTNIEVRQGGKAIMVSNNDGRYILLGGQTFW